MNFSLVEFVKSFVIYTEILGCRQSLVNMMVHSDPTNKKNRVFRFNLTKTFAQNVTRVIHIRNETNRRKKLGSSRVDPSSFCSKDVSFPFHLVFKRVLGSLYQLPTYDLSGVSILLEGIGYKGIFKWNIVAELM